MTVDQPSQTGGPRTGGEIDEMNELLQFAESMQDRLDSTRSMVLLLATLSALAVIGLLGSALMGVMIDSAPYVSQSSALSSHQRWVERFIEPICLAAVSAAVLAATYIQALRPGSRRHRETRALREVISILRETEHAFTREQGWTTLQRAMFRIRLSRFDVGLSSRRYENSSLDGNRPIGMEIP